MKISTKSGIYTHNGEEHSFNFYIFLNSYKRMLFVSNVVDLLVGNNYYSILRDLVFNYEIIHTFTDIDTSKIEDDKNTLQQTLELMEELVYETNILEIVKANVVIGVIDELNKAVDDAIEYRTGIHKNPITESLGNLLNTIDQKISGIDTENMMKMAETLSGISDELTVDKMLEAYAKSDMFKKNHDGLNNEKLESVDTSVKKTRNRKKTVIKE